MIDARTPGPDGVFDITTLPRPFRFDFGPGSSASWQMRADQWIGLSVQRPGAYFVGGCGA